MSFELPACGYVFWPIGTGDSTTIVVRQGKTVVQVDLRHLAKADDEATPHVPIVDELVRLLPKRTGKPYLSVFVLTHPDKDHVLGFADLLRRVTIGEIWHTPRIFLEYKVDLCDDAKKFKDEVSRRRKITMDNGGVVSAGDRVRLIGHDLAADDGEYKDFPEAWHSYPGTSITDLDGEDCSDVFEAFVHAPFKDNLEAERNDTSLALQITLKSQKHSGKALLLGDLKHPLLKEVFDVTRAHERMAYLEWDVLLAPHHCSKGAMYWTNEGEAEETYQSDIMDNFEEVALDSGYIIASADSDFSDKEGKNPPHLKARKRYEEIVDSGHFLCTHEYRSVKEPEPIKFELGENGFGLAEASEVSKLKQASRVGVAVTAARGEPEPFTTQVGFG